MTDPVVLAVGVVIGMAVRELAGLRRSAAEWRRGRRRLRVIRRNRLYLVKPEDLL